ncbi:hypothetical protein ACI2JI_09995 [Enterobacter cancerogenus]|uniref:hypothetical protein n=1 Tax=Enterobacter cancerogenus TaxID=69218 RepID=UPI00384A59C7
MSIARYWISPNGIACEDNEGKFVRYEDYAALEAKCAALAAENAGLKSKGRELLGEACAVYAKFNKLIDPDIGDFIDGQTLHEFQYVLDCETPTTDAFLAEVRAQGVDAAIATAKNVVAQEFQYKDFETAQRVCSKFPESDLVGKVEMVEWLEEFAAQLRKGVQS